MKEILKASQIIKEHNEKCASGQFRPDGLAVIARLSRSIEEPMSGSQGVFDTLTIGWSTAYRSLFGAGFALIAARLFGICLHFWSPSNDS